jgi:hypothetical protein
MTREKMCELFEKFGDESPFDAFEAIENKPSARRDLCVFLLLDRLCPGTHNIVTDARYDGICLAASLDALAEVITEEDIRLLDACGVFVADHGSLQMFV